MKWAVFRAYPQPSGRPEAKFLGHVSAEHHPAALDAACEKWPQEIDETQTQRGFSVRLLPEQP